jgi:glycosyltransferase involved in cell wall biosynthesis
MRVTDRNVVHLDVADRHSGTTLVLSGYPLTAAFRESLIHELGGHLVFLNVSYLRTLTPVAAFRAARRVKADRCSIAIEDAGGYPVLPVLQAIALVVRAKTYEIIHPELRRQPISRGDSWRSLLAASAATADGAFATRRRRRELMQLSQQTRIAVERPSGQAVLYINPNMWFGLKIGGAVTHMSGVVDALSEIGFDVDFASATRLPLRDARTRTLTAPRSFGVPEEVNYFRFQRSMLHELVMLATDKQYTFLYQRMSIHNYVGVMLSRVARVPLILEYNGSEVWAAKNWGRPMRAAPLAFAAESVSLRHAHLVVTVSDALRREVIERGVEPGRVVAIANGFDPRVFNSRRFTREEIEACRSALGIKPSAVVATFVGTFGKWHGVDVLARVIRRFIDTDPAWLATVGMVFLLIGDGHRMDEVRAIIGEVPSERVVLAGSLPRHTIPLHLSASDILLAPHVANDDGSEFFGSPTKLFEYMAMGRAIVASRLGQIAQVLSPGLSVEELSAVDMGRDSGHIAVLVTPGSEPELEQALRFLAADPARRVLLGQRAQQRAVERHTWVLHVKKILEQLERLGQHL